MSDAVVATGVAAGAGIAIMPLLAKMGIDPVLMVAGLVGCIVVQTILSSDKSLKAIAIVTIGSVFFASLATPIYLPWLIAKFGLPAGVEKDAAQAGTAAVLGGFAQPIVSALHTGVKALAARAGRIFGKESEPKADDEH